MIKTTGSLEKARICKMSSFVTCDSESHSNVFDKM